MNEEQLKALQDSILKELGIAIDTGIKTQVETLVKEAVEAGKTDTEDMKEEIKSLKEALVAKNTDEVSKKDVQTVVGSIFKTLSKKSTVSEEEGDAVVGATIKGVMGTDAGADNTTLSVTIMDQFHKDIIAFIEEDKFIKEISFTTITKGDRYSFINAVNGVTTEYVEQAEKGSNSEATLTKMTVNVHKIYSQVDLTEEQYDQMTGEAIYGLIIKFIAESQTKFIRKEILSGNTKMTGVLNLAGANVVELADVTLASMSDDTLIDIQGSLGDDVVGEPIHVMTKYVLTQLRKLKLQTGARMYPELRGDNPTLDGEKVIVVKEAGEITSKLTDITGKKAWVYGVFKNAKAVRRQGLRYEKGYVNDGMLKGITTTVAKQRIGMKVINEKAFTIVKTK